MRQGFLLRGTFRAGIPALRIWACVVATAAPPAFAADAKVEDYLGEAREASAQLMQQIGGELKREFGVSGALRSLVLCKYTAPEVSSGVSKRFGAQVRRVSLRVRNPALGTPDVWEQAALIEFDRRVAAGEDPSGLERYELVAEPAGHYFRYVKAIPVAPMCLDCHGVRDELPVATRAQLTTEYPHDRAVGYLQGQVRGAVSFKKPIAPIGDSPPRSRRQ